MVVLSAICVSTVWGQTPAPRKSPQLEWLEFDQVKHDSTYNGRRANNIPIYAGYNEEKILYAIRLPRPNPAELCVEVTTSFIGHFAPDDFQVKGNVMRVKATAVPRQATDTTLHVAEVAEGYRLTITRQGERLVCGVPRPPDALDKLLQNPPPNARMTPLLRAAMEQTTRLEDEADKKATASETSSRKSAAPRGQKPVKLEYVQREFRENVVQQLKQIQTQGDSTPPTLRPQPEGAGKKRVLPPFQDAGTRSEKHSGWQATGLAEKYSGQVMALTMGAGSGDSKRRGEQFSFIVHRWTCNKSGTLKTKGTFVEIHANGFSNPPIHSLATNTGYLYVGVRNERTQKDIWEEFSLGRSPGASMPFVNILPLKQVTASGLDVRSGDEIVVMVGVCDYSSAKLSGLAHGEVNARVQMIEIEVD